MVNRDAHETDYLIFVFLLSFEQNMSQYNQQPIYVSSNSTQSLNQQQQQHVNASAQNLYLNGPIYVSSNVAATPGGLPNSASNNSVISSQQSTVPNVPIPPPTPIYGQTNGLTSGSINNGFANAQSQPAATQYAPAPIPPQMPPMTFANPVAAPPVPPAAPNGGCAPPPPPPPPGGLMKVNYNFFSIARDNIFSRINLLIHITHDSWI